MTFLQYNANLKFEVSVHSTKAHYYIRLSLCDKSNAHATVWSSFCVLIMQYNRKGLRAKLSRVQSKYNWDTVEYVLYVGMSTVSWPLEFGSISWLWNKRIPLVYHSYYSGISMEIFKLDYTFRSFNCHAEHWKYEPCQYIIKGTVHPKMLMCVAVDRDWHIEYSKKSIWTD